MKATKNSRGPRRSTMKGALLKYWVRLSPRLRSMAFYYASAGLVFWYAVEKIFLSHELHLSGVEIVIIINTAYLAHFVLDVPSSILADRWSRNKTLALSLCSAWVAALIGGLSTSFWMYLLVAVFWAGASALHGGVADALVYDICEDESSGATYPATSNLMNNIFLAAIATALLVGGIIARYGGLRAPYFATLIAFLPVAWRMWCLREPDFHRENQSDSRRGHLLESFRSLKKSPQLLFVVLLTIINNGLIAIALYEFGQLVFFNAGLSLMGVGVAVAFSNTLLFLCLTAVTTRLQTKSGKLLWLWYAVTVVALWLVGVVKNWPELLVVYSIGVTSQQMASRWLAIGLQQSVPSSERAATNSIVGTGSNLAWLVVSPLVALSLTRWGATGPSRVSAFAAAIAAIIATTALWYFGSRFKSLFEKKSDGV
jgi:fucose permease